MESFVEFLTDERIIECVCRKRVSEASKRHEYHHKRMLSKDSELPKVSHNVFKLTPPRRRWKRLGDKGRYVILPDGHRQLLTTFDRNLKSLMWTIKGDVKSSKQEHYLEELYNFIATVKSKVADKQFTLSSPRVVPIFKKRGSHGAPDEYRPICLFEDLSDSIIINLANKYLSRLFDKYFYENSLAFRPKRLFQGKYTTTFHHDAIALISQYMSTMKNRRIYVAECDMQKFYDTVDHQVVKDEFVRLMSFVQEDNPGFINDEIVRIFYSYLDCYNFYDAVWCKNANPNYWKSFKIDSGVFGWVEACKDDSLSVGVERRYLGVPQGGALSGLIANIVINRVDDKVVPKLNKKHDLYVRYCDDMLLLSTNIRRCKLLFNIYFHALEEVNLKPHQPKDAPFGTKEFWNIKSKNVYHWCEDDLRIGSRWIGFVGYEINRHGDVRIRKASLQKEKHKQKNVINGIFSITYNKSRANNAALESSYRGTLMSMAIGRATLWNYKYLKNEFCWINGFKMLNDNPAVKKQIRDLDRSRNHIIMRSNQRLSRLGAEIDGGIVTVGSNKEPSYVRYYGKPFSYYFHYVKNVVEDTNM